MPARGGRQGGDAALQELRHLQGRHTARRRLQRGKDKLSTDYYKDTMVTPIPSGEGHHERAGAGPRGRGALGGARQEPRTEGGERCIIIQA